MSDIEFRILELKEQVTHLEVARNDLQMQMQAQLQVKQQAVEKRRSQARLLRRKEQLDLAITLLNERKEASRADCERLRASNDERRRALAHAKTRLALARREQIEDTLQPVAQALLWQYSEKAKKVSKLRRALIKQLIDLFQLGEDDEGKPTIVGIKLDPERLDAGREYKGDDKTPLEQISSGLGWVVHFLQCVCKYLDLVPPHPMKFWGSKSSVAGHDGTEYDLVADGNGIKQDTFKVAMRLLNTNVCWLCGLAGAMPPHGKETRLLENLKRLSEAARLGWSAPPPRSLPLSMAAHPRNAVRREGPLRVVQAQSGAEVEDFEGIARASTASPGRLPEDGMDDGMEPEPEPELADPYETPN